MTREELAEGIARERKALRRKLVEIRRWLAEGRDNAASLAELCAQVKAQMEELPEQRRRLLKTTASLAIADLRSSEDALRSYMEIVETELRRRGAHSAAAHAYGSPPAKAAGRIRRA